MSSSDDLSISVIVPVHRGGTKFRECLESLDRLVPRPMEVTVVADGDGDGSWRLAEEFGARVTRLSETGGPARARNSGAEAARGEILFFVDADVTVPPESIRKITTAFQRDPDLSGLIGSYDEEPAETNFLSQYKNLFHHYVHQSAREEACTFWGACGAIRRGIFLKAGGFDERYRSPSIEDIELGYRLKQAGYRIRLIKTLQVKHLKRWGFISLIRSELFDRAIPWTRLILRDRQFISDLNLRFSSRISVLSVYGLLGALLGGFLWHGSLVISCALALALLVINAPLYRYFRQKRGLPFALKSIPMHWLYYLYSGLGFAVGLLGYSREKFSSNKERHARSNEEKQEKTSGMD